mgnify:CR=1 FL=1
MKAKPISLQLYSLREASAKDFPAVIQAVADIGYTGVEPAGFYGLKPRELRKIVEDQGMVISSSHGPRTSLDNLQEAIDAAGEFGLDLVSGGFGPEDFKDMAAIRATAEKVVTAAIAADRKRVDRWVSREGSRANLVIEWKGDGRTVIGRSLRRGDKAPVPCKGALVVLKWNNDSEIYYVLTSYPEASR